MSSTKVGLIVWLCLCGLPGLSSAQGNSGNEPEIDVSGSASPGHESVQFKMIPQSKGAAYLSMSFGLSFTDPSSNKEVIYTFSPDDAVYYHMYNKYGTWLIDWNQYTFDGWYGLARDQCADNMDSCFASLKASKKYQNNRIFRTTEIQCALESGQMVIRRSQYNDYISRKGLTATLPQPRMSQIIRYVPLRHIPANSPGDKYAERLTSSAATPPQGAHRLQLPEKNGHCSADPLQDNELATDLQRFKLVERQDEKKKVRTFSIQDKPTNGQKGASDIELNPQLKLYLHLPSDSGKWSHRWSKFKFEQVAPDADESVNKEYIVLRDDWERLAISHQEFQCMLNTGHLLIWNPDTNRLVSGTSIGEGYESLPRTPITVPVMYLHTRQVKELEKKRLFGKKKKYLVVRTGSDSTHSGWQPFQNCPDKLESGLKEDVHAFKYEETYHTAGKKVKNDGYVWLWTGLGVVVFMFALMCCAVLGCAGGGVVGYLRGVTEQSKKVECLQNDAEEDHSDI